MPVIYFKDGPLAGHTRSIPELALGDAVQFKTETKLCEYEPTGARTGNGDYIYSATDITDRIATPAPKQRKKAAGKVVANPFSN